MTRTLESVRRRSSRVLWLAAIAVAGTTRLYAAPGDTVADRELGQGDFVHSTSPSFVRKRSLDLQGDPRGNGVAIDTHANPAHIYVVDTKTNRVLGWSDVASFADGADANLVIGAPDFFTGSQGCQRNATGFCTPFAVAVDPSGNLFVSGDHVEKFTAPFAQIPPVSGTTFVDENTGLDPWGVASDSNGNIYVAMRSQSEVVEYDAGSTTPHLVFGQSTVNGGACNQGGSPSATTICFPYAVAVDAADNLYVADQGNNRVLVYNTPLNGSSGEPGAGDTTADLVIGQSGFTTGVSDTTATALRQPHGLAVDGHGNLYVADTFNHRVTEYDAPLSTGEAATLVIGQPDATSSGCNRGGAVGAGTLCNPTGAAIDPSGNLYVYDADNDRIVAYTESNPPRTTTGSRVLGQHDLTHATENFVDATTVNAMAVAIDRSSSPNHLYAVDAINNRVLGYADAATFTNGGAADLVLGQADFFSNAPNGGLPCCGTTSARVLALNSFGHEGAAVDSQGNLWVSDPGNRRAVGYASPFNSGMAANQPATKVLGEPDLTTIGGGIGCLPTQTNTCAPIGLALDAADDLYLVDGENSRVLEFATPWTFAGMPPEPASLVFGEGSTGTNFTGGGCNQGGESADTLCDPFGIAVDGHGNLYVADADNNRVVEYDKPVPFGGGSPGTPGSSGDVTADLVFGQGGVFNAATCNNGARSAASLCTPMTVSVDPFGSVFVTDACNNRILGYPEAANPPTNVTAMLEFGQGAMGTDFADGVSNAGGLSSNSLSLCVFRSEPGVATDSDGSVYVGDVGNARVLEYDGGFLGAPLVTTTTSTTSTTTTLPVACPPAPRAGCAAALAQKATLVVKNNADDTKDLLVWKWKNSADVATVDFGNPLSTSDYRLCLYDDSVASQPRLLATAHADGTCGGKPCWKATATGFTYKNSALTPDGLLLVVLKSGGAGKAKIVVKGKGANLHVPPLPLTTPVTVQVSRSDGGPCWQAVYSVPRENDAGAFKAKSD
jgi:sugar lactone lactonase YvrE